MFTTTVRQPFNLLVLLIFLSTAAFATAPAEKADADAVVNGNKAALGVIRGVVRDSNGNPISEATVAIFRLGTSKLLKQVLSGKDGSFLAKILPGTYTVLAVAEGFNPETASSVEVTGSSSTTYGFKLERAGAGNTLPEKRLDRNSSKWRIRAAQAQRSIYQNREGEAPVDETASVAANSEGEAADESTDGAKGQAVVETYFAGTTRGNHTGVNFAAIVPVNQSVDLVVAGQTGKGPNVPQRVEADVKYRPDADHQLRFNSSFGVFGTVVSPNGDTDPLGQMSFQALDEWRVREGVIFVFGVDYSRFFGAGDDSSLTPRFGLQFDLDPKTRLRSAFTTQTEERSWANAIDLEGHSVAFSEPMAVDDLVLVGGKPRMNKSQRLEFGIERIIDNSSSVEANVFLDTTFGRGVGLNSFAFDTLGEDGFSSFVADQQGSARGVRVVYTRRLSGGFSTSAGYSFGGGQRLSSEGLSDPSQIFESDFFQSFFAQVAADLGTGTSVRTIYRLSSEATVFAIDPFKGRLAIYDPGLSVFVTQSLPTLGLPFRAEAIVDARNLFDTAAGVSGDEGNIKLNAQGRMLRGGIQVRF